MEILILEDSEERIKQFEDTLLGNGNPSNNRLTITNDAKKCIRFLELVSFDVLFLDHDLGDDKARGTGYDVACWLEQHPERKPPTVAIHSMNLSGTEKMLQAIDGAVHTPGIWSDTRLGESIEKALKGYFVYIIGGNRRR